MENIDGALAFRATLDIDDFNVSAQAMGNRIKDFSSSAIDEVESVEDVFQSFAKRAGEYISYYLVGQGMMGLLNSMEQACGQMGQTAAKTPFDLMGVAEGAKQLMAYGVSADKVNDTLVRLGNIASGLSIPLNDIVYLYGTTMVQGRLYAQDVRQFTGRGIPLVKELAEKYGVTADKINEMVSAGKIGFPEVEEAAGVDVERRGSFSRHGEYDVVGVDKEEVCSIFKPPTRRSRRSTMIQGEGRDSRGRTCTSPGVWGNGTLSRPIV